MQLVFSFIHQWTHKTTLKYTQTISEAGTIPLHQYPTLKHLRGRMGHIHIIRNNHRIAQLVALPTRWAIKRKWCRDACSLVYKAQKQAAHKNTAHCTETSWCMWSWKADCKLNKCMYSIPYISEIPYTSGIVVEFTHNCLLSSIESKSMRIETTLLITRNSIVCSIM